MEIALIIILSTMAYQKLSGQKYTININEFESDHNDYRRQMDELENHERPDYF